MATAAKTPVSDKPKRAPVALLPRIMAQLDRAVLSKKVTKAELATLAAHVARLDAFLA